MASWMVHLRTAEALLSAWTRLDETAFIMGNLAPDSGVPNADWSAFDPPYSVSHFKTKSETGSFIDIPRFCAQYFDADRVQGYHKTEYAFFLGYYAHLLTDRRWSETIYADLLQEHPKECAEDKSRLVRTAKEDWYDLDFLYLEQHPDFKAFRIYENAGSFDNTFMDLFSRDALENRRRYICGFYRGPEHGDLHRSYRYLTPERVDCFVRDTAEWILGQNIHLLAEADETRRGE